MCNSLLGISELELVATEHLVGDFKLDILCTVVWVLSSTSPVRKPSVTSPTVSYTHLTLPTKRIV